MKILSLDFENNKEIPDRFTCEGENVHPQLYFEDVPTNIQSLAIIVDDPDAPAGTWTHWTIWNIDPKDHELGQGSSPDLAVEGITSNGGQGYDGPCPPVAETHHYHFKLFALDTMLDLGGDASIEELESEMQGHIIEESELIGTFRRE